MQELDSRQDADAQPQDKLHAPAAQPPTREQVRAHTSHCALTGCSDQGLLTTAEHDAGPHLARAPCPVLPAAEPDPGADQQSHASLISQHPIPWIIMAGCRGASVRLQMPRAPQALRLLTMLRMPLPLLQSPQPQSQPNLLQGMATCPQHGC